MLNCGYSYAFIKLIFFNKIGENIFDKFKIYFVNYYLNIIFIFSFQIFTQYVRGILALFRLDNRQVARKHP